MDKIINLLGCLLLFVGVYYLSITFFGFSYRKETYVADPQNVFAIIIPAHNEEGVVSALVENCRELDYPKNMYDIFVVADNCTDRTADIARQHGAACLERHEPSQRGKGFALEWAIPRIRSILGLKPGPLLRPRR